MADKCPTCKGPAVKERSTNLKSVNGHTYRSTAAEQLAELQAANRELIRQHEQDRKSADIRAKAIRQAKEQLADKEQVAKEYYQMWSDDQEELKGLQTKLAAAEAVVEAAREWLKTGADDDHEHLIHAMQEYDKLQGGE